MGERPTPKQEERLVRWVNRQRKWRFGVRGTIRRLPRGVPEDSCECVLARALGGRAQLNGDGSWCVTPWRVEPLPKYVAEFEQRFDNGLYPALEDSSGHPQRADIAAYYGRICSSSTSRSEGA